MNDERRILACVDQSHFADTVTDYASWAAQRVGATLELLHVIDREPEISSGGDHSGAIGFDAKEQLLETLSDEDAARSKASKEAGRLLLNRLRTRALDAGTESVDVRQRHGSLDETLADQEERVRIFVLGRRGASAEITQRDIGRNVERMVRALTRPILTVTEDYREPKRVLIAFDGSSLTKKAVGLVAKSPLFAGLPVHVLTCGQEKSNTQKGLQWAKAELEAEGFDTTASFVAGDPEAVIAKTVKEQSIDMLVMGAYTHSRLRSIFFGSKTNGLLRSATIPSLLLR